MRIQKNIKRKKKINMIGKKKLNQINIEVKKNSILQVMKKKTRLKR